MYDYINLGDSIAMNVTEINWRWVSNYWWSVNEDKKARAARGPQTEAEWNNHDGWDEDELGPKPTWEELVEAHLWGWLDQDADFDHFNKFIGAKEAREEVHVDSAVVNTGPSSHMTGLLQIIENSNIAGNHIPHIVMRDTDHNRKSISTQREVREILAAVAVANNRVESAHNALMSSYYDLAKIRDNLTLPVAERVEAAEKANALVNLNYKTSLLAEIEKYDPDVLPADLPTLKAVLTERLEAAAMARVKEIKGANTQQGVDVPAACFDMATALEEVSAASALGIQNIDGAEPVLWKRAGTAWVLTMDTPANVEHEGPGTPPASLGADGEYYRETGVDDAQAAFKNAVGKIEAVTPLNVPEWVVTLPSGSSTNVTATASHPAGQNIPGRVQITLWRGLDGDGAPIAWRPIIRRAGNAGYWEADIPAGTKYPVTINLSARNLCGPSSKKIIVPAPA